jgi:hypothetical protein
MRHIHPGLFSNRVFVQASGHDAFSENYTLDHFREPPVKQLTDLPPYKAAPLPRRATHLSFVNLKAATHLSS